MVINKVKNWILLNRREISIVLLLFVVAGVPRIIDLGTFLTADEKNWMGRSFEFVKAFKDWRFNDMLQTTHPGVTTLWLSGLSITAQMFAIHTPFSFRELSNFILAAQLPIALVNSLLVPVIYLLMKRLFKGDGMIALVASLFIALNPFIVGYSRVAHVDALLSGFIFSAALAMLIYAQESFSRRWLLVSAVLSGLALLTKAPAVFLLPFFVLVVLVYGNRKLFTRVGLVDRLRDFLLWLLVVGILFVTIWPAILWVPDPEGNILLLKRDIGNAAATPHHMADSYTVDVAFYLGTLVTRLSPAVMILAMVFVAMLFLRRRVNDNISLKVQWLLLAYVFFFLLMMMLGAKKGDRYILPVFLAIDVLAVIGLVGIGAWFGMMRKKFITVGLAIVVIGSLGLTIFRYHPYAIAYSNPLFPDNLSQELGWGEGLEKVGEWLDAEHPDAVVASWYPEELGAYTGARVAHINAHEQGKVGYIVLYRNMFGRALDHPANDFIDEYYKKRLPVHTVKIIGKEFAWVFEKPVYERVVGELVNGFDVEQELEVTSKLPLLGLDVMTATYSGKANQGFLAVRVTSDDGKVLHSDKYAVADLPDSGWFNIKFDQTVNIDGVVSVEFSGDGTTVGNAPTLRYTRDNDYRSSEIIIAGDKKAGDLGVRLRYLKGDQEVTEDDTRLLSE